MAKQQINSLQTKTLIQTGITASGTIGANSDGTQYNITFPKAYSATPIISATIDAGTGGAFFTFCTPTVLNRTTTGCSLVAHNFGSGTSTAVAIQWTAIGT